MKRCFLFWVFLIIFFTTSCTYEKSIDFSKVTVTGVNYKDGNTVVYDDDIFVMLLGCKFIQHNISDGKTREISEFADTYTEFTVYDNKIYYISFDDAICRMDFEGKNIETLCLPEENISGLRVVDGILYYLKDSFDIVMFDLKKKEIVNTIEGYSSYEVCNNGIYYNTFDGYIKFYNFDNDTHTVVCETASDKMYMHNKELYFLDNNPYSLGISYSGFLCKINLKGEKEIVVDEKIGIPIFGSYAILDNFVYYIFNGSLYKKNLSGNDDKQLIYQRTKSGFVGEKVFVYDDKIICFYMTGSSVETLEENYLCYDVKTEEVNIISSPDNPEEG